MGKVKKKERRKRNWKNIWNPKNLQKEVHAFGYDFRWQTYLLAFICVLLLIGAVGIFFRLQSNYIAIISLLVIVMLPVLIVDMYKRMYEQKRFADATDYMEQVLYAFRKNRKVLLALKECKDAMPEGMMKQTVAEAVEYLERGKARTEKGALGEALEMIESAYKCEKIHTVHELLISAEERGGNAEKSIQLLLDNIEVWKRQVYMLQSNKKKSHMDNVFSIVVASLLCGLAMYIMEVVKDMVYVGTDISVFKMTAVQVSSFAFILMCLWTFYKSTKKLTDNWLDVDRSKEKSILRSYEYVKSYDEKKERNKSILIALPFLIASVPCYIWLSKAGSIVCILIAVFMLVQHRFSYNMSRKEVEKALYMAFPQWMMDIALLLQTNNVQVSIDESMSKAEAVLLEELQALKQRVEERPGDVQSYTEFCKEFNIPEIASCMKMLYSISESGTGNADAQIEDLMKHIHRFQEREAELRDENIAFNMKMIFFIPVAGTSIKLLVDMAAGTLLVFQLFSQAF